MNINGASANPGAVSLQGQWAGDRLQLSMDAQGGRVQTDCANGTIAGPLQRAADGRYTASGTFEQHRPGPQRNEAAAPAAAQYSGELHDGVLTLSILPAGASTAEIFRLREGARVKLVRCL